MPKSFALTAFNTAVAITNGAHAAKRGVVAAASFTTAKEAGSAFWAGMRYAHHFNKAFAAAAGCLTPEDIEASKPSTKPDVRIVSKSLARSAK